MNWSKILLLAPALALAQQAKAADFDELIGESRDPAPRLRWGAAGLFGANSFPTGGNPSVSSVPGAQGIGGLSVALTIGGQWTELLSTSLELGGTIGIGAEARGSVLLGLTPLNWLSLGVGPELGAASVDQCTGGTGFYGGGGPQTCEAFSAGYFAGELRVDFLPGAGPGEERTRRSFDIAIEGVAGASLATVPAGANSMGWGFYLLLGYLQY